MDNTTRVKVGLMIWQRPGYGQRKRLRLGQISGVLPMLGQILSKQGVSPLLGQISGQTRGFPSARENFRPKKGLCQC